jgi:hypothetical protein
LPGALRSYKMKQINPKYCNTQNVMKIRDLSKIKCHLS